MPYNYYSYILSTGCADAVVGGTLSALGKLAVSYAKVAFALRDASTDAGTKGSFILTKYPINN